MEIRERNEKPWLSRKVEELAKQNEAYWEKTSTDMEYDLDDGQRKQIIIS